MNIRKIWIIFIILIFRIIIWGCLATHSTNISSCSLLNLDITEDRTHVWTTDANECSIINELHINYYQNNKLIAARTRFICSRTSRFAFAPRTNFHHRTRSRRGNRGYLIYVVSAVVRSRKGNRAWKLKINMFIIHICGYNKQLSRFAIVVWLRS